MTQQILKHIEIRNYHASHVPPAYYSSLVSKGIPCDSSYRLFSTHRSDSGSRTNKLRIQLTKAHSTKTCQTNEYGSCEHTTLDGQIEQPECDADDGRRLQNHDQQLTGNVAEQHFDAGNA